MTHMTNVGIPTILLAMAAVLCFPTPALAAESDPADGEAAEATEEAEESGEVTMEEMLACDGEEDGEQCGSSSNRDASDWTWRITRSAFWGGVTGALVGVGLFLIGGDRFDDGVIIAQLAGGGILVGAGLGVIAVLSNGGGANSNLDHPSSVQWIERDMPRTYELNIIRLEY